MEYTEFTEVSLLSKGSSLQLRHRFYQGEGPMERFSVVLFLDGGCTAGSEHATLEEAVNEFLRTCEGDSKGKRNEVR